MACLASLGERRTPEGGSRGSGRVDATGRGTKASCCPASSRAWRICTCTQLRRPAVPGVRPAVGRHMHRHSASARGSREVLDEPAECWRRGDVHRAHIGRFARSGKASSESAADSVHEVVGVTVAMRWQPWPRGRGSSGCGAACCKGRGHWSNCLAVNAQTSTTAEGPSIWIRLHRWGWYSPYMTYAGAQLTQRKYSSIPIGAR